jgi:hypothetical protein
MGIVYLQNIILITSVLTNNLPGKDSGSARIFKHILHEENYYRNRRIFSVWKEYNS